MYSPRRASALILFRLCTMKTCHRDPAQEIYDDRGGIRRARKLRRRKRSRYGFGAFPFFEALASVVCVVCVSSLTLLVIGHYLVEYFYPQYLMSNNNVSIIGDGAGRDVRESSKQTNKTNTNTKRSPICSTCSRPPRVYARRIIRIGSNS